MNEQMQAQVRLIVSHLRAKGLTPDDMMNLGRAIVLVLQDPAKYPQLLQSAMQQGLVQPGEVPEEFNPQFLTMLLLALKQAVEESSGGGEGAVQEGAEPQAFARGGLAQMAHKVAAAGRAGDTMLAHINPREAEVLRRMGGSGTVNPNTGLREFKGGEINLGKELETFGKDAGSIIAPAFDAGKGLEDLGKRVLGEDTARQIGGAWKEVAPYASVLLPVAANFFMPGLGAALTAGMGGGALGTMGTGALMGGLGSALGGGNFAQGAVMGGLGAGGGKWLGDAASGLVGQTLGAGASNVLGSGLAGGALNALQGKSFTQGAMQGAMGGMLSNSLGGLGDASGNALSRGIYGAGTTIGNAITSGYNPREALTMGLLSGVARGLSPAQVAAGNKPAGYSLTGDQIADTATLSDMGYSGDEAAKLAGGTSGTYVEGVGQGATAAPTGFFGTNSGFDGKTAAAALPLLSLIESAQTPEQIAQQVQSAPGMSEQQKQYYNRAATVWDWGKMQQAAAAKGMGLGKFMAQNWNDISAGKYNAPGSGQPQNYANGGLNSIARLAEGGGSGRADTIDAKLSDGEYVFDAETVALLGDGSVKEGARRLEEMRANIRKHKGAALKSGKISPDAKSPLAYLKETA